MNRQNLTWLFCFIVMLFLSSAQFTYAQAGWIKTGSDPDKYNLGVDSSQQHDKQNVMTLRSIDKAIDGFGASAQYLKPEQYFGKRVRMTGYMKTKGVIDWAGFWFRVDPADTLKNMLAFDNMEDRPIKGTTGWNKYSLVLDIPNGAANIVYGTLLGGRGQIWFSNPVFEVVDNSVPTTGPYNKKDSELVAVAAQPCEKEPKMKSLNHNTSTFLKFRNNTSGDVTVYWINYSGQRDTSPAQIRPIAAGKTMDTRTFLTHPFIVIGSGGKCYGIFEATAKPSLAVIKD